MNVHRGRVPESRGVEVASRVTWNPVAVIFVIFTEPGTIDRRQSAAP